MWGVISHEKMSYNEKDSISKTIIFAIVPPIMWNVRNSCDTAAIHSHQIFRAYRIPFNETNNCPGRKKPKHLLDDGDPPYFIADG